jgi:hypothetical protein
MSKLKLKFYKQSIGENEFELITELVGNENDIRQNWAILGLRYAKELSKKVTFDALEHIEDTGAEIVFLNSDYFFDIDLDEDESDDFSIDDLCDYNSEMAVGMELNVFDAYKRIGGLMSPSVLLARIVFSELEKKRQAVKL